MESLFVEGLAAVVSAVIVFCGSVWLLLALVLGPRLAYFITASVTLGFLLLMGAVWSYGDPLGPVGETPSYTLVGAGDSAGEAGFGPASEFPDGGGWFEPGEDDAAALEVKTGAESVAARELERAIEAGRIEAFERADDATVDSDSTRVLDQDGTFFVGVRLEPLPTVPGEEDAPGDEDIAPEPGDSPAEDDAAAKAAPDENAEAFVFVEQDPGNQSGEARLITAGFLGLLALHLFGLSWSEKRARRAGGEA